MNKSWERLTKRKRFPGLGWVKSVEVTRCVKDDSAHPHFHVLMMVPSSYFTYGYVTHAEWTELWQSCLRVDYTPVINIKAVKARPTNQDGEIHGGIIAGLLETLKYGVKEDDLVSSTSWLHELTLQLHKTRAIAVGGVLRKYISEEEPTDEELIKTESQTDEEVDLEVTDNGITLWFDWMELVKRYVKSNNK
jgi:hypothetical protein